MLVLSLPTVFFAFLVYFKIFLLKGGHDLLDKKNSNN